MDEGPQEGGGLVHLPFVRFSVSVMLAVLLVMKGAEGWAQLQEGLDEYQAGNYEKAIELLEEADKGSSAVEFLLGMSYKKMGDYDRALHHLRNSVKLEPKIKEALPELIDTLHKLYSPENAGEAYEWIRVAETQDIFPGRIAFLKGLFLQKEGKYQEAMASFEEAGRRNPKIRQAAEFQIARCYAKTNELDEAKLRLEAAIQQDPSSDLAAFARQYADLIQERIRAGRPLRLTLGAYGQYDTNVVLKPLESSLAPEKTDEGSRAFTGLVRLSYMPRLEGRWLFNSSYTGSGLFHDKFSTSHDVISNSIYMAPGYSLDEKSAVSLSLGYDHALVRGPSYKRYVGSFTAGPLYRSLISDRQMVDFFVGYRRDSYYRPVLSPHEDRDGSGLTSYLNWVYMFKQDGLLRARYEFSDHDTDGMNWEKSVHGLSLNLRVPVAPKLGLNLGGKVTLEDYENRHSIFGVQRNDDTYYGSIGMDWEVTDSVTLIGQFAATRGRSNIPIYDYERELYTVGLEYRY